MTASDRLRNANTAKQQRDRMALARAGWVTPPADKLTEDEAQQLEGCEGIIENGFKIWQQVGDALLHIRDARLYRERFATFEEYLAERWSIKRQRAYELMSAASVVRNVSEISDTPDPIRYESHAAALSVLDPAEQRIVYQFMEETAPNGKVTESHVKSMVNVIVEAHRTGAIDSGTGESIPLSEATPMHYKAAFVEESYERLKRQETYVAEKQAKKKTLKAYSAPITLNRVDRTTLVLLDCPDLPDVMGTRYRVVLYEIGGNE